jgi:hypothetical protein
LRLFSSRSAQLLEQGSVFFGPANMAVSTQSRRGLVLAGGGAKGAYQFGCLMALKEHSVVFDVISGTSIGALNALLWSTGNMEKGKEIWQTLSQDRILPWRVPPFLGFPLGLVVGSLHSFYAFVRGLPLPIIFASPSSFALNAPFLAFAITVGFACKDPSLRWIVFSILLLQFGGMFICTAFRIISPEVSLNVLIQPIVALLLNSFLGIVPVPLFETLALLAFSVYPIVLYWFVSSFPPHLLNRAPLRSAVDTLAQEELQSETYICTAAEKEIFDPDKPQYIHPTASGPRLYPHDTNITVVKDTSWIPRYFRLNEFSKEERVKALLASAALPFGIVPRVTLRGENHVDGGMIDNVPIYPLIDLAPCDEIVVIQLSPKRGGDSEYRRNWQRIDRLVRLSDFYYSDFLPENSPLEYRDTNDPPKIIPLTDPPRWPRLIITISPSASLGNFLGGTLNFSAKYAQQIMQQGYNDARAVITNFELGSGSDGKGGEPRPG